MYLRLIKRIVSGLLLLVLVPGAQSREVSGQAPLTAADMNTRQAEVQGGTTGVSPSAAGTGGFNPGVPVQPETGSRTAMPPAAVSRGQQNAFPATAPAAVEPVQVETGNSANSLPSSVDMKSQEMEMPTAAPVQPASHGFGRARPAATERPQLGQATRQNNVSADHRVGYIKEQLSKAEAAYWKLQLTTPPDNNAYRYYQNVLQVEPDNVAATVGLQRITDKYISLAKQSLAARNSGKARNYLNKALQVDPASSRAKALLARLNTAEKPVPRQPATGYSARPSYATFSSAKRAYRARAIDKYEYKRIVSRLKDERSNKLIALKQRYRAGKIDKHTYKQAVRKIKARYE